MSGRQSRDEFWRRPQLGLETTAPDGEIDGTFWCRCCRSRYVIYLRLGRNA